MASGTEAFYLDPTFWVAGSFVVFVGGVVYAKAHKKIAGMLDDRSQAIAKQIEEAQSLRDEAEKMLADYQRKQRQAEQEASDIIDAARQAAEALKAGAEADIEKMIERRTRMASEKIAQEEANAVKEVRSVAADVAIAAAETVLADSLSGKKGKPLVEASIGEIEAKLS